MIHFSNIRSPKSLEDFITMNAKGETSNPSGFQRCSTFRAPWYGNVPGQVNSPVQGQNVNESLYTQLDDDFEELDNE